MTTLQILPGKFACASCGVVARLRYTPGILYNFIAGPTAPLDDPCAVCGGRTHVPLDAAARARLKNAEAKKKYVDEAIAIDRSYVK